MRLFDHIRPVFAADTGSGGGAAAPFVTPAAPAPSASATVSSPSPSTPTPPPADPAGSSPDSGSPDTTTVQSFEGLGGFEDDDVLTIEPDTSSTQPTEPVQTPPATTPAPATPAVEPAKPVASTPPQEPAQPAAPQPPASGDDIGALLQQFSQHKAALVDGIAAAKFTLSKEELEALESDVAGTVPKLLARTYFESQNATLAHINNLVPQMVVNIVKLLQNQEKATNAFYGKYKGLDQEKHAADVAQFASIFKQQNPALKQDDLWSLVASAVAAKHNVLNLMGAAGQPPGPNGQHQMQPAVPAFVPAQGGSSVRVTPEVESPFAGLGRDHED